MEENRIYTKEVLEEAVKHSFSYSEVCRYLGRVAKGGTYELIKNRIIDYNINIAHFLGQAAYAGKRNPNYQRRENKEEILKDNKKYRVSHNKLKRALIEYGTVYKCCICNIDSWLDGKITLDVDHIDGNWKNCQINNLRFLCPNCHRQTNTFAGKNIKRLPKKIKLKEKKIIVSRMNENYIRENMFKIPVTMIAKNLGVTDSGVLKFCKKLNIETPKRGYWGHN